MRTRGSRSTFAHHALEFGNVFCSRMSRSLPWTYSLSPRPTMLIVTEWGMPYQVRVSSSIVFFRIGSFTLLTQSQLVTGSWTTSPVSHNPGLVVRPLLANSSLLGSTYGGSRPVTRSVNSVTTMRAPTTRTPIFKAFIIFVLRNDANHTISRLRAAWFPREVEHRWLDKNVPQGGLRYRTGLEKIQTSDKDGARKCPCRRRTALGWRWVRLRKKARCSRSRTFHTTPKAFRRRRRSRSYWPRS